MILAEHASPRRSPCGAQWVCPSLTHGLTPLAQAGRDKLSCGGTRSGVGGHKAISQILAQHLPSLRRYARALTGSQPSGDDYVGVTLEAILTLLDIVHEHNPKVALFRSRLSEALVGGIAVDDPDNDLGLFSGPTHQPTGATAIGKSAFNDRCGSR